MRWLLDDLLAGPALGGPQRPAGGLSPRRVPEGCLRLPKAAPWPALATEASGLARLTQSSQSTDLRTYQPLSSRVEMYSVVQSSPVAPTTLVDCAT